MTSLTKKSGQKIVRRLSRFSAKAREASIESVEENVISRTSHLRDVRLFIVEWCCLVLGIILLAIAQASWYSSSYSYSGYVSGGTFTEATLGKVSSLNPLFATTNSEKTIATLLFSGLTKNDYSGHVGLALAESIDVSDDGKEYLVRLRDNLYWSDGEPLTADDVIFTAGLIQDHNINTAYSANLSGVKIRSHDDGILFVLPSPYSGFESALDFPILPEHILGDTDPAQILASSFSSNPVSSGPFSFNASQSIGNSGEVVVYLSSNQYYYKPQPMLDSFAIHAYPTKDPIITAVNAGTITATAELTASDTSQITSNRFYSRDTTINTAVYAFFNCTMGIFSDSTIRSAVREGVNIDQVREVLGVVKPVDYPILDTQTDDITWPEIPSYNNVHAKEVLSRYELTPITLVTTKEDSFILVAEAFAGELRDLGFEVNIMTYDPGQEFIANIIRPRAYDILIYDVDLGAEPDILAYYHSSQATENGYNLSNYKNTFADDLILASRTATDESLRKVKYSNFLSYWVNDVPAIGIYQTNLTYYYNNNVKIFSEDITLVSDTDRFAEVEYWSSTKSTLNRTP